MTERTKQPPLPGNMTSSAPPRQISWPGTIDAEQNKPLLVLHSCKGRSTTAVSSAPLRPPEARVGHPNGCIRHTATPATRSSQLWVCCGVTLPRCCAILVTLYGTCTLVSLERFGSPFVHVPLYLKPSFYNAPDNRPLLINIQNLKNQFHALR